MWFTPLGFLSLSNSGGVHDSFWLWAKGLAETGDLGLASVYEETQLIPLYLSSAAFLLLCWKLSGKGCGLLCVYYMNYSI